GAMPAQKGLLNRVFGVGGTAEHAVGDGEEEGSIVEEGICLSHGIPWGERRMRGVSAPFGIGDDRAPRGVTSRRGTVGITHGAGNRASAGSRRHRVAIASGNRPPAASDGSPVEWG